MAMNTTLHVLITTFISVLPVPQTLKIITAAIINAPRSHSSHTVLPRHLIPSSGNAGHLIRQELHLYGRSII
ncbi:hypothetical protein P167DRAFT_371152 [Morchella conica CCBAS932]|uniref:Secreted protein n=1 Tax=Morchella conica CCBAS932 TaxID=1392247 RepID=A0A3N4KC02_9PEZI|nr:hypothetical protein P167DRAFT_371152 [Morchella conica CCBAS932]